MPSRTIGWPSSAGRTLQAVLGMDEAIARAHLMVDLGADLVFVEAPSSRSELEQIGRDLSGVPLVVNQVEGGRTPLLPRGDLAAMGYRVILRPGFATRVAITAVERAFRLLAADADEEATAADVFPFGDLQDSSAWTCSSTGSGY